MPGPRPIPAQLLERPFTLDEAKRLGVTARMLRGKRFVRIFPGVYASADLAMTHRLRLVAGLRYLPAGSVVSHVSACRLWGLDVWKFDDLHFSTTSVTASEVPGITVHRRTGTLHPVDRHGMPTTGPDRTFVDCALQLSLIELVQLGDHLVRSGATGVQILRRYVAERHLDGVQRARQAAERVTEGVESPTESLTRMALVLAGLPCPEVNVWIVNDEGRRIARVDLLFAQWKLIVEYDGIHHERDARQRQRDRERREDLDALGYRMIVITNADLANVKAIALRVHAALVDRGYRGARPSFGAKWRHWFARP